MKNHSQTIAHAYSLEKGGKAIRTINPPIFRGSTVLFESYQDLALANKGEYPGLTYGTDGLPPQKDFEDAICALEGGAVCRTFQSGIAAIVAVLQAFTKAGDHIIVCDNVYWPTSHFCDTVLAKFGVETSYAPSDVGANIQDYIRENTVLIFMESPGSNTLEIQDIDAIVQVARERNIITVHDGTWGTPLYLQALSLGVDISIQSASKYIAGHSDVLLGTVCVNAKYADTFAKYYKTLEIFAPSQDCYTALKGLKTLHIRLAHHQQIALNIASWLETHPQVECVIHPGLASHPQHDRFLKYFSGSSGLFSFIIKDVENEEQVGKFVDALELFGIGYSWGGYKSLVTAGQYGRKNGSPYAGKYVFRLSIGFEDEDDLRADLEKGFTALKA